MSPKLTSIHAFIDGANLYSGVKNEGWAIDYSRFRRWLTEKLGVTSAYIFIGLVSKNTQLYQSLQEAGFILVFKPTITGYDGKIKGNCDADMVLDIVSGAYEKTYAKAVIVTSDGDFYSTVEFLQTRNLLQRIISPSPNCSILLKRTNASITYINEIKQLIEYKKKKPPMKTKHHKGSFHSDTQLSIAKHQQKIKNQPGSNAGSKKSPSKGKISQDFYVETKIRGKK